jgi:hypothetical protein
MKKSNPFLESIRKAQAAARPQSVERDLSALSEAELDAELLRAQEELRRARERELAATRQAADSTGPTPKALFAGRRQTRRPWK